jgi:hypothetical protein
MMNDGFRHLSITSIASQLQRFAFVAWQALRSPRITAILAVALVGVVLLRLIAPQQDTSIWFWLPLALLFLNGLIAIADYGPGSWRRRQSLTPPLTWQHPLAQRIEHSARLPESPDTFLASLKERLAGQGFVVYEPLEAEERIFGAARRPWAWLGVVALYSGAVLVALACLVSYHFSKADSLALRPFEQKESSLFNGNFELTELVAGGKASHIVYKPVEAANTARPRELTWRLYWPALFQNALVWPFAAEPVLTIEVQDRAGNLLKLIPVQENLPPSDRLNLQATAPGTPLYFSIPAANIAVQVVPGSEVYTIQVRRAGSSTASEPEIRVEAAESFAIDDELTATITPNYGLRVLAYRDPALPLYLAAAILIVCGGVVTLFLPPLQLWFIPEIRGRGGQVYGVMEKFGAAEEWSPFLEGLLTAGFPNPEPGEKTIAEDKEFE